MNAKNVIPTVWNAKKQAKNVFNAILEQYQKKMLAYAQTLAPLLLLKVEKESANHLWMLA